MAYAYCRNCGYDLPSPSLTDAVIGYMECPECDEQFHLHNLERKSIVQDFEDDFLLLKEKIPVGS